MKVLWIAPNGGCYNIEKQKGGGWISSLEKAITSRYPELELGIAFLSSEKDITKKKNNVTYFPIYATKPGKIRTFWDRLLNKNNEPLLLSRFQEVINDYCPDILHIWGAEHFYIQLIGQIKIPYIVHIQGFASMYQGVYLPAGVSLCDLKKSDGFINRTILKRGSYFRYKSFSKRAQTEKKYSRIVKNWIGRTDWDKACAYMYNPSARYYHCDELMRDEFLEERWEYHYRDKIIIQSSISEEWYKGIDLVIRTATILSEFGQPIAWNIYGMSEKSDIAQFFIKKYNCKPKRIGVFFHGKVSGDVIRNGLLSSDVYVHPSYIENSSNAIVEAQTVGIPVIAQHVGGNSTMLAEEAGILVPSNDPTMLARTIIKFTDQRTSEYYSEKERLLVQKKSKDIVLRDIMAIYNDVIDKDGRKNNNQ